MHENFQLSGTGKLKRKAAGVKGKGWRQVSQPKGKLRVRRDSTCLVVHKA